MYCDETGYLLYFMNIENIFFSDVVYISYAHENKCPNFNMFEIRSTTLVFTSKTCFGTILDSSSSIGS